MPLSYFDRLTHACVDIQGCPLATPTLARYVNCQARPGQGEAKGAKGARAGGGQSRTKIKQTNGKHKRGWIFLLDGRGGGKGNGNCHLPSLHVLNLSFDLRPQLCRLLYRQYTLIHSHTHANSDKLRCQKLVATIAGSFFARLYFPFPADRQRGVGAGAGQSFAYLCQGIGCAAD